MRALIGSIVLIVLSALIFLALLAGIAHGSTTTSAPRSETRVDEYLHQVNVIYGSIIDGKIIGTEESQYTLIRIQPYHKPLLYDVSILFCGYQGERFRGMSGPIAVYYDAVAPRVYEGVPCFNLMLVDHWIPPKSEGR